MKIAIYMEGGGPKSNSQAMLRQGMDAFLAKIKDAYCKKKWNWKLVPCGGRDEAHKRFQNERRNNNADIIVLLVDSETKVFKKPAAHLAARDGWNFDGVDGDFIHLMVQTMETWIVADPEALASYYEQGFQANTLPRHQNLEAVRKRDIAQALNRATQRTRKGKYHKIQHARHLLQQIDPVTVREKCPHCERLFEILLGRMDSGV